MSDVIDKAREREAMTINDRLKAAARRMPGDPNRNNDLVHSRYVYERLLARLQKTSFADRWVIKGGVLMLSLPTAGSRFTMDMDWSVQPGPKLSVGQCLREICAMKPDPEDGLDFTLQEGDKDALRIIREEADEPTVRGKLVVTFCLPRPNERRLVVDITGAELAYKPQIVEWTPTIRGFSPFPVYAYPWELVLAEKLHAVMTGTMGNPRLRDYMDVIAITDAKAIEWSSMPQWLERVFEKRGDADKLHLGGAGLTDEFAVKRQKDWIGTMGRTGYSEQIPASLADAIAQIKAIANPILEDIHSNAISSHIGKSL